MYVIVADEERSVREALHLLLTQVLHHQSVREAATVAELWALVQDLTPDLLLVDWALVRAEPRGLLARLRTLQPSLRVIALGSQAAVGREAIAAGADAFVCKGDPPDRVLATLRATAPADGAHGCPEHEAAGGGR